MDRICPKTARSLRMGRIRKQRLGLALRGASGQYDPFQSDPALSDAISKELNSIKSLTNVMIKTELAEYNVSSGSLKDRRELEYALAVARVKKELKAKEEKAIRSKKAMRITEEVAVISDFTDSEIIDELHCEGSPSPSKVGKIDQSSHSVEGITYQDG